VNDKLSTVVFALLKNKITHLQFLIHIIGARIVYLTLKLKQTKLCYIKYLFSSVQLNYKVYFINVKKQQYVAYSPFTQLCGNS